MPDVPVKLTEARVRDARPPLTGRLTLRDATSPLQLRITTKGVRTWYVNRRVHGKPTRVRLGTWPDISVERARKLADAAIGDIARNVNPAAERKRLRAEAAAAVYTFGEALADYIDDGRAGVNRKRPLKKSTLDEYGRLGETTLKSLAKVPLRDLDLTHVDTIRRANKPSVAAAGVRVMRAVANGAVERGKLAVSPLAGRKRLTVALPPRQGKIEAEHLGRFLLAVEELQGDASTSVAIGVDGLALMLVYGLRKSEVLGLAVTDIDRNARTFTVSDTKAHRPLTLPLTHLAERIIDRRAAFARRIRSRWLFPSISTRPSKTGHLSEVRSAVKAAAGRLGLTFMPHDLRRTLVSSADEFLSYQTMKAVVNHASEKSGDVTLDAYSRIGVEKMRPQLEAWHAHLETLRTEAADRVATSLRRSH